MSGEQGPGAALMGRVRNAAHALESVPSESTRVAGAALLEQIQSAIRAADYYSATRLVGHLEALVAESGMPAAPPPTATAPTPTPAPVPAAAPASPSVSAPEFEPGDLGLPPPRTRKSRAARPAPARAPSSAPEPVPAARPPSTASESVATAPPAAEPATEPVAPLPIPLVGAWLGRAWAHVRPSHLTRVRLAISVLLGIGFVLTVGLAAHWRLLYGIDTPGIYSPQDFLYRPSVDVALPSLLAGLTGSNPYATLYLTLAIEAGAISYSVQMLAGALARGTFRGNAIVAAEALAAMLYLANPYILSFGNTSLYSNVLISNAAFIAFLAILVTTLWDVRQGRPITREKAILMGLAIGLSNPYAFPNFLRIQAMIALALALGFAYLLLVARRAPRPAGSAPHPLRQTLVRFLLYTIPPAALLVAYPLYSTAETYLGPAGPLKSIISSQPFLQVTEHNTFPMVVRLLGKGTLHTFQYAAQLNGTSAVAIASWAWPVVALGLPLAIMLLGNRPKFLSWRVVLTLEAFCWISLAWAAGSNPPFGAVVQPITRAYPALLAAFPIYYPEYQILAVLYPILAACSIVWVGSAVSNEVESALVELERDAPPRKAPEPGASDLPRPTPRGIGSWSGRIVVVLLAALLLLVALPVSTGQSLAPSGRVGPGGFVIPSDYATLRTELQRIGGSSLLLPGVQSHIQTSWGYDGASSWYTLYNYPVQVIQPATYGPFEILQPPVARMYQNLTAPLGYAGAETSFFSSLGPTVTFGGPPNTLTLGWVIKNASAVDWPAVQWVGMWLMPSDRALMTQLLLAGDIETGIAYLSSGQHHVGWFPLGLNPNSNMANETGGVLNVTMMAPFPSLGGIDLSNVTGLEVRMTGVTSSAQLSFQLKSALSWSASNYSSTWIPALRSSGASTVLIDANLVNGTNAPVAYGQMSIHFLVAQGYATLIWSSADLYLYRLALPAQTTD